MKSADLYMTFVIIITDTIPDMARSGVSMGYSSPQYRKKDQKIVLRRQSMPSDRLRRLLPQTGYPTACHNFRSHDTFRIGCTDKPETPTPSSTSPHIGGSARAPDDGSRCMYSAKEIFCPRWYRSFTNRSSWSGAPQLAHHHASSYSLRAVAGARP